LNKLAGRPLSYGVVTPFRQQENMLQTLLQELNLSQLQSGTAHQFQGDECDFMFFLPVLSNGIEERTLQWLERTYNLLNVAITRARVGLFILGDFDFCRALQPENKYHRLAEYVGGELRSIFQRYDQLPIYRIDDFDVVGNFIDPLDKAHNRMTFKRFLRTCQDYLWWIDSYFDRYITELISDVFVGKSTAQPINEIKLLVARKQLENTAKNWINPDHIGHLKRQLEKQGIKFDMRSLPLNKMPHDRFLYSHNKSINMPPFDNVFGINTRLSEYTLSASDKSQIFEPLWAEAEDVISE
jgi:hypothetical protein